VKFPLCSEVCSDCKSGNHIFHVLNELGDMWAEKVTISVDGETREVIRIFGHAEDELWFEDLLKMVTYIMTKDRAP